MLLKNTENEIIDPLLHICNFSFSTGTVQKTLKMATITAMYKNGDKCPVNNYRPVSLLIIF